MYLNGSRQQWVEQSMGYKCIMGLNTSDLPREIQAWPRSKHKWAYTRRSRRVTTLCQGSLARSVQEEQM